MPDITNCAGCGEPLLTGAKQCRACYRKSPLKRRARIEVRVDREGTYEGRYRSALVCSFCSKTQREVKRLIAGPTVYICDECVELCVEIIDENNLRDVGGLDLAIPGFVR